MSCPEPGIYPGVSFEEYITWEAAHDSFLAKMVSRSAMHAKWDEDNPRPDEDYFVFGHALHTRILECEAFPDRYTVAPKVDKRTKVGQAAWAAFQQTANGKDLLTQDMWDAIKAIADNIKAHGVQYLIQQGQSEVSIVWDDKETGLRCKARMDYFCESAGYIFDIKSDAMCIAPQQFSRRMYNLGYHQKAAFYVDGVRTLTDEGAAFVFIVAEKKPPYAVAGYEVNDKTIEAGRNCYHKALKLYQQCRETGVWPGYSEKVELIDVPYWALEQCGVNPRGD